MMPKIIRTIPKGIKNLAGPVFLMSLSCSFLLDDNYCFLFFILSRKASVKLAQE